MTKYQNLALQYSERVFRAFKCSLVFEENQRHPLRITPYGEKPHDWSLDKTMLDSFLFYDARLGGKIRKRGNNIPEMAHILWVAHRNYNAPFVRKILEKHGVNPVLAAFVGFHHDTLEGLRKRAEDKQINFDQETALQQILALWPNEAEHSIIRAVINDYMTDKAGLDGDARIEAQRAKPLSPDGNEVVYILNVMTRSGDKMFNGISDMLQRILFENDKVAPSLSLAEQRRFGVPDADVAEAAHQIQIKGFAVNLLGVPREDRARYVKAEKFLVSTAQKINTQIASKAYIDPERRRFSWAAAVAATIVMRTSLRLGFF